MLVSSPSSPPAAILTESQALTAALFGSWLSEIGPAKKILFQCEGILAEIPYPLLMTAQGAMGLNHEWALTRSAILDRPDRSAEFSAAAADRLLVDASHVASLASWNLQPLPFPREEQQALRRLGGRLAELQGKGASAAGLREALGSTSLLHFAGHAVSRNGTIGLLLDDGFLEMEGVSAPGTVVLSACSTGRAHQQEVDTLSAGTLAHAFVLAGAADVLASSWNLDSTAAAEFASVLYARLGAGEDFGMASLEAVRHLAHVAAFAHPYYWAGQMRLIRT
jgi:CHAT domain-containing protein